MVVISLAIGIKVLLSTVFKVSYFMAGNFNFFPDFFLLSILSCGKKR